MHKIIQAVVVMLLCMCTSITFAKEQPKVFYDAIINLTDGTSYKVHEYYVSGDRIFYKFMGQPEYISGDMSSVASITDPQPDPDALPPITVEGRTFPRLLSYGKIDPSAESHPEFMHVFADWFYDLFAFEPALRAAAYDLALESSASKGKKIAAFGDPAYFIVLYKKTGFDYLNSFDLEEDYESKLNQNEYYEVNSTLKAMPYYFFMLSNEEGIRAGVLPSGKSHESETPKTIRAHVKALLSKYRSTGKDMPDQKEAITQVWEQMRQALAKGDVEKASSYFSESSRDGYRKAFQAMKEAGTSEDEAARLSNMHVNKVIGGWAEGDIRVPDKDVVLSFLVRFSLAEEGVWKIEGFVRAGRLPRFLSLEILYYIRAQNSSIKI